MRLTVLGCAGSFPGPEAACSAYLVEAEGFRLLIDFGSGSLSALQRYAGIGAVDAILLTHLHCDHMLDACTYVVVRRYAPGGPMPPLPVYAPMGAAERISAAYSSENEPVDDVYTFYALQPGTFPIGPLTVTVDRVNHPIETYGVRVEHNGGVLAYSSDTAPCDSLLRLAQGADLFLCEASYLDGVNNPPDLHLTGGEAGEAATKADVRKLLLTHLVPAWVSEASTVEAASAAYSGPVEVVRPGARYDL
ncbi:MBL fold metallo-hydrolase [Amorphoplanes digitatis]|uniref:Ribonuclease BN (tRNA processing enzyme) n=1 Tax=Actinoplanes digitatis TaxID=1868 RepID=A0A7W7MU55_9ACTN|nr:MBL fold metallo-hydrolase [Actinoplanes digitatis]MBB4766219.1 ribonuclease BN (tRNA processing enzyme) [Actinoplanes digitatis]GID96008.1 MBL fold metallo-hydrolase [Actinoplanes digitatis]